MKDNWLKIAGSGIRMGQMTREAETAVQAADVVLTVIPDRMTTVAMSMLNPEIEDLTACYVEGKERLSIYGDIAGRVMERLREGKNVCFLLYGHPLVFAYPPSLVLEAARQEGFAATVIAGISAEDLVFSELQIDPALYGCSSYSASSFVDEDRPWDSDALLVLWQVGVISESRHVAEKDAAQRPALTAKLSAVYGEDHPAILFESSFLPYLASDIRKVKVGDLTSIHVSEACTVVIPPRHHPDFIHPSLIRDVEPVRVTWQG